MTQSYNEYAYPSSLEEAKIHEEASSIGSRSSGPYTTCKCCENQTGKTPFPWKSTSVSRVLQNNHGVKIPFIFDMMKAYGAIILIIFCVNGIYAIYQYQRFCDSISDEYCSKIVGLMPIITNEYLVENLLDTNEVHVWEWLNFVSYLVILFGQIFVGLILNKRDQQEEQFDIKNDAKYKRTLKISCIPDHSSEEDVLAYLKHAMPSIQVSEFFFVRDFSSFYLAFFHRTRSFFEYLPLEKKISSDQSRRKESEIKKLSQLKTKTMELQQVMHVEAAEAAFKGQAIITLQTRAQCEALKHALEKSSFTLFKENIKMLLSNPANNSTKSTNNSQSHDQIFPNQHGSLDRIRLETVPAAHSLQWAFTGISQASYTKGIFREYLVSIGSGLLTGFLMIMSQQKAPPQVGVLGSIIIMTVYQGFMEFTSIKKRGRTVGSKAAFLMSNQATFFFILFGFIPALFFGHFSTEPLGQNMNMFFSMFMIGAIINTVIVVTCPERIGRWKFWRNVAKNPDMVKTIPQKEVNASAMKPEFALEVRIIAVLTIWTVAALQSFVIPYTLIAALICLAIMYPMMKKRLFESFSLSRSKDFRFIRKFMTVYSFIFQCAILVIFMVVSKNRMVFKLIAAACFVISNISICIMNWRREMQEKSKIMSAIQTEKQNGNNMNDVSDNSRNLLGSIAESNTSSQYSRSGSNGNTDGSFRTSFENFVGKFQNVELEKSIENELKNSNPYLQDASNLLLFANFTPWIRV